MRKKGGGELALARLGRRKGNTVMSELARRGERGHFARETKHSNLARLLRREVPDRLVRKNTHTLQLPQLDQGAH